MTIEHVLDLGLTPADVADTTDDYYTPRWIFDAAGLIFDMDVCAPVDESRRTCPAITYLTPLSDGLALPWHGLVWMNPPYSQPAPWVRRFVAHRNGLALVPAIKSLWIAQLLAEADTIGLLGDVVFGRPNASMNGSLSYALLLAAFGAPSIAAARRIAALDRYSGGVMRGVA